MQTDVCVDAGYKKASIVQSPTPGFNPLHWSSEQWQSYIADYVAVGAAVTLVLLGMLVVLQLALYLWRCIRCVWIAWHKEEQQQRFNLTCTHSVLTHKWTWVWKWIATVLGCGAIAFCVAGMILLPSDIVKEGANVMKPAISYAGGLLGSLDGMLSSVQSISPTIDKAVADINNVVNIDNMNQDLQCLLSLGSVSDPAIAASALQQLDSELQLGVQRTQNLSAMMQAILLLSPAMAAISSAASNLQTVHNQLSDYTAAAGSLPSVDPGPTSAAIISLSMAQANLQAQQQSWTTTIANLSASVQAVEAARDNHTLTSVADQATQLYSSVQPTAPLQQQSLPAAIAALQSLRQALDLAAPALPCAARFAATLRLINATLIAFPPGPAVAALQNLTAAEAALQQLTGANLTGDGPDSALQASGAMLDRLLQALQELPGRLQGAPDPSQLAAKARSADATLQMVPDPSALLDLVAQVQAALTAVASVNIDLGSWLAAYRADSSSAAYATLLQAAKQAEASAQSAGKTVSQAQSPAATAASVVTVVQPTVQDLLQLVSTENDYVASLLGQLGGYPTNVTSLLDTLTSLEPAWQAAQAQQTDTGVQSVMKWVSDVVNTALDTAKTAQAQVQQSLAAFGSSAQLHDILDQASHYEAVYEEQGNKWWGQYAYNAWLGIYALLIILVLVTIVMVFVVCPGGLRLALAVCLLYATLFLLLALALSGGWVVGQDTCWAAERLVVAEVSTTTPKTLLTYYLSGSSTQSVAGVLKQANIVDVDQVQASLNTTIDQVAWLTGNYTLGSTLQPSVASIQQTLLGVQPALTSLLAKAAYDPVHTYYLSIKSFACCDAATDVFVQWVCMAAAGLLVIFMAIAELVLLSRLDALPCNNCCGFQCYRAADYKPRDILPDGETTPSSAPDSLVIIRDMNDTGYLDQLHARGSQLGTPRYSAQSSAEGKLSFHYFGPPTAPSQKRTSRGEPLRGALPSAPVPEPAWPRDTAQRDAMGRSGSRVSQGSMQGQGSGVLIRAGSTQADIARLAQPGSTGSFAYPAAAVSDDSQLGDRGGLLLPTPPPQLATPASPAASRQQGGMSLSSTPSGTVPWYGEPAAAQRGGSVPSTTGAASPHARL